MNIKFLQHAMISMFNKRSLVNIFFAILLVFSVSAQSAVYFSLWNSSNPNSGPPSDDPLSVAEPICDYFGDVALSGRPVRTFINPDHPNQGEVYDRFGNWIGMVYTCEYLDEVFGWTVFPGGVGAFREVMTCPAATGDNNEYDAEGCGCSNPNQQSLFNEEGEEQGCRNSPTEGNNLPATPSDGGKNPPCGPGVGPNPCDYRTGAKYRHETDFSYGGFTFTRNYHSLNMVDIGFGMGWHNHYLKSLSVDGDLLAVYEGTGRGEPWTRSNGVWTGDADSDYLITESAEGYTVTLKRGDVHEYDLSGQLLSETDTQGKVQTYEYDAENRLIKVSNHYQQSITFTYSNDGKNHITKVVDAEGVEYGYEYDTNDNLIAVVYPDGDSDSANNPKRIYHYEDVNFPNHITGITNASGERYATFAYNADGKAIESALAPTTNSVGQQRVQLNYQGAN